MFVILIGGCSRSGKSTLASNLQNHFGISGIDSTIVHMDSWIIDIEKRKSDSKVLERYNVPLITDSLMRLLKGEIINLPLYNPLSRKCESSDIAIHNTSKILIIEGVITLCIKEFIEIADLKIFVDVSDFKRIKRLIYFYKTVKKLNKKEYKEIISKRENEEVPFIKGTKKEADWIYQV